MHIGGRVVTSKIAGHGHRGSTRLRRSPALGEAPSSTSPTLRCCPADHQTARLSGAGQVARPARPTIGFAPTHLTPWCGEDLSTVQVTVARGSTLGSDHL